MNETDQQLAVILGAMQSAAKQYGPQALELALNLRRIEAIQSLVIGWVSFAVLLIALTWVYRWCERHPEDVRDAVGDFSAVFAGLVLIAVNLAFSPLWGEVFDAWNYVALIRPDYALAHDLLMKVMK